MTMSMKDLCLHVCSIERPHDAAEELINCIAQRISLLATRTDVSQCTDDLRANAHALAEAVFWGTPLQLNMAKPEPVEPPWTPQPEEKPAEPGAHLDVEPAAAHSDAGEDESDAPAQAMAEDAENGPIDEQPHKRAAGSRRRQ